MPQLSRERRNFLEKAVLRYAAHLDLAADWLEGRGIDKEFAASVALGVVVDPMPGHEPARGRLAIPYLTDAGPVGINFRCIQDHNCKEQTNHSKYWKPKGSTALLYGVQSASWAEHWIVATEGEIDALTWQMVGVPAVGIPGAKNWKDHWSNVFEDFSRVYLAEDGDSAGESLYEKMVHKIDQSVSSVIRMEMPDGEDSNSMYVKKGKDYLLSRIKR